MSWVLFAILVAGYSCVQFGGPSGLAVESVGWAKATLYAAIMTGFVLLAIFGSMHQGKKLRARKGEPFVRYLESTSAIPFVAIAQGRQRLILREIPWIALGLGALFALGVRQVHDRIFAWYGAPFIATVIGGSMLLALITTSRWRRGGVKDLPFPRSDPSLPRDVDSRKAERS